jgi:hypothetical protein
VSLTFSRSLDFFEFQQRKADPVQRLISDVVSPDGKALETYDNNPTTFTWTDGTPKRGMSSTPTGAFNKVGMLFNVTVPESTHVTAVRVYVGSFAHVKPAPFHATLLDSKGKTLETYVLKPRCPAPPRPALRHTHTHTHTHTRTHAHTHTHTHAHTHTRTHHKQSLHMHTRMRAHTFVRTSTNTYMCARTCAQTHTHTSFNQLTIVTAHPSVVVFTVHTVTRTTL